MTLPAAIQKRSTLVLPLLAAFGAALLASPPAGAGVVAATTVNPSYAAATGGGNSQLTGASQINPRSLSGDGRWLLSTSAAQNLVAGQTPVTTSYFLYLRDRWNGTTQLVSRSAADPTRPCKGMTTNGWLSRDGRYVAFLSSATDLVAGQVDTNNGNDLFLYDRITDSITLVSHIASSASTTPSSSTESAVAISENGVVAFSTAANNLIGGITDTTGYTDVFVYDPASGTTTLVSRSATSATTTANKASTKATISADGNVVAYASAATNLVAGQVDSNNVNDLFGFDRGTGATFLITHTTAGPATAPAAVSYSPVLSYDGAYAFFGSSVSTGFFAGQSDTNAKIDAFLYERATGNISLVSHAIGSTVTAGNSNVLETSLSIDDLGEKMAYLTNSKLDTPDTNTVTDTYLYRRSTQTNAVVGYYGSSGSTASTLSADGDALAFRSSAPASAFLGGVSDSLGEADIFVYDTSSSSYDVAGRSASFVSVLNGSSDSPQVSADGSVVAAVSNATNFTSPPTDYNAWTDVLTYQRSTQSTEVVSLHDATPSATPAGTSQVLSSATQTLSGDGTRALFLNRSTNMISPTTSPLYNQIYLFDSAVPATYLVSHKNGQPTLGTSGTVDQAAISRDGSTLVFASTGNDHTTGVTDTNGKFDLFSYDPATGAITQITKAAGTSSAPNNASTAPSLSSDGRYLAFLSYATNLMSGLTDTNSRADLFWLDRQTGTWQLVSHAAGSATTTSNDTPGNPILSADGQWVVFPSAATNLVTGQSDSNGADDLFLWSAATGTVTLVSHASSSATLTGNRGSAAGAISADGAWIAFPSFAGNLVAGFTDINGTSNGDVYLFERATGNLRAVSFSAYNPTQSGGNNSFSPAISDDGAWVAYSSRAVNLHSGSDGNSAADIFLYDRAAGANTLVSHTAAGATITSDRESLYPSISADGSKVAFQSRSTNLVTGQIESGGSIDVFRFDRTSGANSLLSPAYGTTLNGSNGENPTDIYPLLSADGTAALFSGDATNLVPGDFNSFEDVFVYDDP